MSPQNDSIEIVVCLGSSCFARGNSDNLAILKNYETHALSTTVRLTGCLCQDKCGQSPNVTIDGKSHPGVTPEELRQLLDQLVTAALPAPAAQWTNNARSVHGSL